MSRNAQTDGVPALARGPLSFAQIARDQLVHFARASYPRESCGLLVGRRGPAGSVVRFASEGRNLAEEHAHDRYELDPAHVVRIEQLAEKNGLEVLGVWHTHPDHPAEPSERDRERAWPGWSYVIASVRDGDVRELRSWRLVPEAEGRTNGEFREERVG